MQFLSFRDFQHLLDTALNQYYQGKTISWNSFQPASFYDCNKFGQNTDQVRQEGSMKLTVLGAKLANNNWKYCLILSSKLTVTGILLKQKMVKTQLRFLSKRLHPFFFSVQKYEFLLFPFSSLVTDVVQSAKLKKQALHLFWTQQHLWLSYPLQKSMQFYTMHKEKYVPHSNKLDIAVSSFLWHVTFEGSCG